MDADADGEGTKTASELREGVLSEAVAMAMDICRGAPLATDAALKALGNPSELKEKEFYGGLLKTEDRMEGLRAFEEKRDVVFKGR